MIFLYSCQRSLQTLSLQDDDDDDDASSSYQGAKEFCETTENLCCCLLAFVFHVVFLNTSSKKKRRQQTKQHTKKTREMEATEKSGGYGNEGKDTKPPSIPSMSSSSHRHQHHRHRDNKRNGGVKSRDAENAWKGKLREQVLRRVKENRREILSAARNRRAALMETILSAEMTRSSVKRGDSPVSSPFNIEKGDEDEDEVDDVRCTATVLFQKTTNVKKEAPSPTSSVDSRSWDDVLATSSTTRELSKEEYDELISAMLMKIDADEKKEEELVLLAAEQKYAMQHEADEKELDLALEQMQAWEIDERNSDPNDPVVLCPLCKTRRLLTTPSNKSRVFCGCENGFNINIDGGLVFLRDRLASAFENHRAFTMKGDGNLCAEVDLKFQFGHRTYKKDDVGVCADSFSTMKDELSRVLFASCDSCGFLEAII